MSQLWTDDRKALAIAEALRWGGTQHVDGIAEFGRGIDCIHYVGEIIFASGILPRADLPSYNTAIGMAKESETLEQMFAEMVHCELVDAAGEQEPEFGDIVVFKSGRRSVHCGWYENGNVHHCMVKGGVVRNAWGHRKQLAKCFVRLTAEGWR